jgi:hypothetical protein
MADGGVAPAGGLKTRSRGLLKKLDDTLLHRSLHVYETALLEALDGGYDSLLDVGCGPVTSASVRLAAMAPHTVGVDGDEGTVARCRELGPYHEYHCLDGREVVSHFGPRSFDVVVALDVVEHFEKDDGWRFLDAIEAVARRRVVVFTPNGFLPQGEKDHNPLQIHRSGWTTGEFRARGYTVTGINGWKPLRGELWEPRIKPPAVGHRVSACTQPLVTRRPHLAFQLLAVRDLSPKAETEC